MKFSRTAKGKSVLAVCHAVIEMAEKDFFGFEIRFKDYGVAGRPASQARHVTDARALVVKFLHKNCKISRSLVAMAMGYKQDTSVTHLTNNTYFVASRDPSSIIFDQISAFYDRGLKVVEEMGYDVDFEETNITQRLITGIQELTTDQKNRLRKHINEEFKIEI